MQPLLLLHGAIGASDQLLSLSEILAKDFKVYTLDFSGHGGKGMPTNFSIETFAKDVLNFLEANNLNKVSIFGYSMGGYVGMYIAKHYPEKITKIITLATKFHWDEIIAAREIQMLNPEKIESKIPAFAQTLQQRHQPNDWKEILHKSSLMLESLGRNNILKREDYATIDIPALILLGDRDKMVSLEETVTIYKTLPNAQMGILPNTAHPIEQVDSDLLGFFIRRFIRVEIRN
ncbi:MAG TPA: alpha/beta hydrolase [Flavipsychrobacter sp.]|nr:alpha/beta hydrolase [Flavipsychrobacter sp.]